MAELKGAGGVVYRKVGAAYFEQRGFRRYAGVWSLWALGVGAVISGHYSGWNLGLATGGWGGMLAAGIIIMIMYLGLVFCIAEMAPALPHTGAAYSFARSAMVLGAASSPAYARMSSTGLTPAVIVFFIGSYMGGIFETPASFQPIWWILMYAVFLALNIVGVELSFRVATLVIRSLRRSPCSSSSGSAPSPTSISAAGRSTSHPTAPSCRKGTAHTSRSEFMVFSPRCLSPCGYSWRSSNCR